jgi:hypothetical protein
VMLINPGYWIWRVAENGIYQFHSEAMNGAGPNAGTFTTSQGHYTLHAISRNWDDSALMSFKGRIRWSQPGSLEPEHGTA